MTLCGGRKGINRFARGLWTRKETEVLGGSGANQEAVETARRKEDDDRGRGRGGGVLCARGAVGSRAGRPGSAPRAR